MSKLIAVSAALVLGTLGVASVQLASSGEPAATLRTTGTVEAGTTTTQTTETTGTVEKATTTEPVHARAATTVRAPGEDVRGPCDEAEHAGDPRCAGGDAARGSSGPGPGRADDGGGDRSGSGRRGDDPEDDDRSGSNSGRG